MSNMWKIVLAAVCLTGCFGEPGKEDAPASCSDLREEIVLECEAEANALAECADHGEFPDASDCPDQLTAVNDCFQAVKATQDDTTNQDAASQLAYSCDLNPFVPGLCEDAEEQALELGVEECPLPGDF